MNASRLPGIDFFRVISVFAVILIHTLPFRRYDDGLLRYLGVFINQGARFAVPYFFVIAGYFWGKKVEGGSSLGNVFISYSGRILGVFFFGHLYT